MIKLPKLVKVARGVPKPVRKFSAPLAALSLYKQSALQERGWFNSINEMMPVDKEGNALPWLNYPAIQFLDKRISEEHTIFEYGSGNSTKWLAKRVDTVVSVEHDLDWSERVAPELPDNAHLYTEQEPEEYAQSIYQGRDIIHSNGFDIVLVDGNWRNRCVTHALSAISDGGIIVLDDSKRGSYLEAKDQLEKRDTTASHLQA